MDAPLSQGRVILGKYRIERVLGKGAMGVVLAARHIQLDDRVAIKLLLPEMLAEPGVQERFLREAKAARRLKSEHVTHVIDVGELETGTPYIIMEYLEGKDLAKIRGERGALEIEEVVDYVLQACDAIAEAHSHGIIHRDLKPANLFLTRRPDGSPFIKVLDFGTSKMPPSEADPSLEMTQTGMAIGSPSYMAPEQMLSSRNLDARADIWALGVILYNLLTGAFPFRADTLLQMCAAVIQSPPNPPSMHRADLPPALEDVILKCLQKRPEDRFSDISGLARGLLPFATAEARYHVERIERVLGVVTSDLATFLAPSVRSSQIGRDASAPAGRSSRPGSHPEGPRDIGVSSKSLTMTSMATDVTRRGEGGADSDAPGRPKRRFTTLLIGAGAALTIGAGLFFMLQTPLTGAHVSPAHAADGTSALSSDKMDGLGSTVRPIETAMAIRTPTAVAPPDTDPSTLGSEVIGGSASSTGAPDASTPSANASATAGPGLATKPDTQQDKHPRRTHGGVAAPHASPSPQSTNTQPAPSKIQEPAVIIPDDR